MNNRSRTSFVVAFLAPAASIYAIFVLWPLVATFQLSLYRYRGLSASKTWNFPENYKWLFENDLFWRTLKNNAFLLVFGGITILILSLLISHAMASTGRLSKVLRSVFLFPQIISVVVVAVIWQFIYNPSHGLLNATIGLVQSETPKTGWIAQSNTALFAVTIAFIWWALGFYVMLFTAGLQSIPSEVTEAAELDGATGWNRFSRITWPMLWSIKRISAIYLLSNVLNVFALVFVMTQGGPDNATQTMLTFLYQTGFEQSHYGRASALAACNFVLALGLSGLLFFFTRRNPEAAR